MSDIMDQEINAIMKINEALSSIEDNDTLQRVLAWAIAKFGIEKKVISNQIDREQSCATNKSNDNDEIPGIACLTDTGDINFTIRDLKAKSTNDAALRLAHIAIYTYTKLKNETSISSSKTLLPLLNEWRCYTGNTRRVLSAHKGIIRKNDKLSLDTPAQIAAEEYVRQICDQSVKGTWNPSSKKRKTKQKATDIEVLNGTE